MPLFGRTFRVTSLVALGALVAFEFSGKSTGSKALLKGKYYIATNFVIRQEENVVSLNDTMASGGRKNNTVVPSTESNNNTLVVTRVVDEPVDEPFPSLNPNTTAAFIHLGKTGGSSLSLQLRNGCHSFVKKPCHDVENETIVSEMVTDYYHIPDVRHIPTSRHETYFVTSRDPLERLISAFCYMHPKNRLARNETIGNRAQTKRHRLAHKCFPTLESFAEAVGNKKSSRKACNSRAQRALKGQERIMTHLWGNYRRMVAPILIPSMKAKLYVFRREHLWNDWTSVNALFAPNRSVIVPTDASARARDMATVKQPVTRELSDKGRGYLCRAIQQEYKVYFALLDRAINLNATDIQEARDLACKNCPQSEFC